MDSMLMFRSSPVLHTVCFSSLVSLLTASFQRKISLLTVGNPPHTKKQKHNPLNILNCLCETSYTQLSVCHTTAVSCNVTITTSMAEEELFSVET